MSPHPRTTHWDTMRHARETQPASWGSLSSNAPTAAAIALANKCVLQDLDGLATNKCLYELEARRVISTGQSEGVVAAMSIAASQNGSNIKVDYGGCTGYSSLGSKEKGNDKILLSGWRIVPVKICREKKEETRGSSESSTIYERLASQAVFQRKMRDAPSYAGRLALTVQIQTSRESSATAKSYEETTVHVRDAVEDVLEQPRVGRGDEEEVVDGIGLSVLFVPSGKISKPAVETPSLASHGTSSTTKSNTSMNVP
ncbi:hypothetical protein BDZ89DRAFT_1044362 [Hymenopellis radicata]|nr:hypothetical protein BDZ89DRAFT_1044362 [Hymenopellis radicata]